MPLEVHQIRALKGKRQLTELLVGSAEQAAAAQAAGIDMVVSGRAELRAAIRAAAPEAHFCFGLIYGHHVNADEARRAAFAAMEAGADSIYCCMGLDVVEAMAREGIPVVGHAGLVPQKARWTGFRAFGKTAEEAKGLWRTLRAYEDAGAFAVELEVVAEPVATALARASSLTVISMGSGPGCDVQYLFAADVLGETRGRMPRHARRYEDFAAEHDRLQARRVEAFRAFRADVESGAFPGPRETVVMPEPERLAFEDWLSAQSKGA